MNHEETKRILNGSRRITATEVFEQVVESKGVSNKSRKRLNEVYAQFCVN